MSESNHDEILRQGTELWNKWRKEHADIKPRLSAFSLRIFNLPVDFSHVSFSGGFSKSFVTSGNFNDADLSGTSIQQVGLRGSQFRGADLSFATFIDADLGNADLSFAKLQHAKFINSGLVGANLAGAEIGYTIFADTYLHHIQGVETIKHTGPSTIGIDTLYVSQGEIPEKFLRGCGVPDVFVAYARSLTVKAFDFYSCFISYSNKNLDFAKRLHTDLQNKQVRCWMASEDLKIGDKFRQQIDNSIWYHDKVLLVLSEASIASPWVEDEIESAFERERKENRLVLFPVRIDDAVMKCDLAWAASLRRTRHIGDFTNWKSHDEYQKAFNRLLRDLKAEPVVSPA